MCRTSSKVQLNMCLSLKSCAAIFCVIINVINLTFRYIPSRYLSLFAGRHGWKHSSSFWRQETGKKDHIWKHFPCPAILELSLFSSTSLLFLIKVYAILWTCSICNPAFSFIISRCAGYHLCQKTTGLFSMCLVSHCSLETSGSIFGNHMNNLFFGCQSHSLKHQPTP